jgi:cytochrome c oxidase subunit 2
MRRKMKKRKNIGLRNLPADQENGFKPFRSNQVAVCDFMNHFLNSVFHSESPRAGAISDLFIIVLIVCAIILFIVTAMVSFSLIRFRHKPGSPEPKPGHGNWKLETTWTVIPFLVLIWLLTLTARGMKQSDPAPDRKPDLLVISHQWWWEARYSQTGVVTANEIHIPVGVSWLIALESADVIHDFWVPRLGPKMDVVPGHPNHLWLEADKPGSYLGTCSEFCGAQHAQMHFLVIAEPATEFEVWQKQQEKPAVRLLTAASRKGEKLFRQMTCVNCHTVNGTDAKGQAAPDLTHFASRQTLGAVILANTPENLSLWLKNPQEIKPAILMPNLKLTDAQVGHLTDYLESLQ